MIKKSKDFLIPSVTLLSQKMIKSKKMGVIAHDTGGHVTNRSAPL